jgi:hypothetical protein
MAFFIVTAVKTSNLTVLIMFYVNIICGAYILILICLMLLVTTIVDPPYSEINGNIRVDLLNENPMNTTD